MKNLLITVITLFVTAVSFGQGLDLGLKVGVNFANITDASGLDNRTGFVFGAFAGAKLGDKIGIQGDLLYSQQGADADVDKIDLNYVNIPIVLKYFVTENLHIHAGPQFGFVVDDNVKQVFSNIAEAETTDVSGIVGAGIDLPMGIRIDGRYNFGLTDVLKSAGPGTEVTEPGKNSVITLSLGYSFL
ncbi:MAG: porin family protein [Bacteroidota bacterium]